MNLAEYEHMMEIYTYVFSTPPNSPERTQRLEEIQKNYPEEDSKLWDFHSGLLSGRINAGSHKQRKRGKRNEQGKEDYKF